MRQKYLNKKFILYRCNMPFTIKVKTKVAVYVRNNSFMQNKFLSKIY